MGYNSIDANKYKQGVAPSTHVRSIHKVKSIAKYLSKYCGKNSKGIQLLAYSKMLEIDTPKLIYTVKKSILPTSVGVNKTKFFRPIYGKLWGCSENLSRLKKNSIPLNDGVLLELSTFKSNNSKSFFTTDFCEIIKIDSSKLLSFNMPNLRSLFIKHCHDSLSG